MPKIKMLKIEIPLQPITKKNSQRMVFAKGRVIIIPSEQYKKYEKACVEYMPTLDKPIDYPINLKVTYFMQTRRKCDLTNLLQATCDILVKYKVLEDDNYTIVNGVDGSRVYYDKENPRCIIEITKLENYEQ